MTLVRKTPMPRPTKPMPQMSAKKRAERDAAGVRANSTFTPRRDWPAANVKPAARKWPTDTGPDAATVAVVRQRDQERCVRCGAGIRGERGRDWSIQHRRARGSGGSSRPDTNQPQNLILLCGSATTLCHGHVEAHSIEADDNGWSVPMHGVRSNPLLIPVTHFLYDRVYLTADGGYTSECPAEVAA